MEKYYTPDLSEFYIGFEYELQSDGIWFEVACDLVCDEISQIKEDIKNGQIRVKYLDKEDIESLGFEQNHGIIGKNRFIKHPLNDNDYTIMLMTIFELVTIFKFKEIITNNVPLFFGTIKNKSELKKLLIQLGI